MLFLVSSRLKSDPYTSNLISTTTTDTRYQSVYSKGTASAYLRTVTTTQTEADGSKVLTKVLNYKSDNTITRMIGQIYKVTESKIHHSNPGRIYKIVDHEYDSRGFETKLTITEDNRTLVVTECLINGNLDQKQNHRLILFPKFQLKYNDNGRFLIEYTDPRASTITTT